MLVDIASVDFEYDLQRWHDHLKVSGDGGYTWRRNIKLPKIMKEALASPEWNEAVRRIREATYSHISRKGTEPGSGSNL